MLDVDRCGRVKELDFLADKESKTVEIGPLRRGNAEVAKP
jgi:hypothetical protein